MNYKRPRAPSTGLWAIQHLTINGWEDSGDEEMGNVYSSKQEALAEIQDICNCKDFSVPYHPDELRVVPC